VGIDAPLSQAIVHGAMLMEAVPHDMGDAPARSPARFKKTRARSLRAVLMTLALTSRPCQTYGSRA